LELHRYIKASWWDKKAIRHRLVEVVEVRGDSASEVEEAVRVDVNFVPN